MKYRFPTFVQLLITTAGIDFRQTLIYLFFLFSRNQINERLDRASHLVEIIHGKSLVFLVYIVTTFLGFGLPNYFKNIEQTRLFFSFFLLLVIRSVENPGLSPVLSINRNTRALLSASL